MHSYSAVALFLLAAATSVSGQSSQDDLTNPAQASVLAGLNPAQVSAAEAAAGARVYLSADQAEATVIGNNPTIQAALSTVPGASTRDFGADLASLLGEAMTYTTSGQLPTDTALFYLTDLPTTGPAATLLATAFAAAQASVSAKLPGAESSAIAALASSAQASGFARSTGGLQVPGVARSSGGFGTGLVGTGSQASGVAKSTGGAGVKSSGAAQTTAAPKSSQAGAQSSTALKSSAPKPQSTTAATGGVASQPTGAIMAAGAAAAGVLGFAAML